MLGSMSQHLRVIVGFLNDLTLKDMETRLANSLLKQCLRPVSATQVEIKLDQNQARACRRDGNNERKVVAHASQVS